MDWLILWLLFSRNKSCDCSKTTTVKSEPEKKVVTKDDIKEQNVLMYLVGVLCVIWVLIYGVVFGEMTEILILGGTILTMMCTTVIVLLSYELIKRIKK